MNSRFVLHLPYKLFVAAACPSARSGRLRRNIRDPYCPVGGPNLGNPLTNTCLCKWPQQQNSTVIRPASNCVKLPVENLGKKDSWKKVHRKNDNVWSGERCVGGFLIFKIPQSDLLFRQIEQRRDNSRRNGIRQLLTDDYRQSYGPTKYGRQINNKQILS